MTRKVISGGQSRVLSQLRLLSELFSEKVDDPRVQGRCKHKLVDILVIIVCAHICGAESCVDIENFACTKLNWLKKFLELRGGAPSHDTIERVLSLINPTQIEKVFFEWAMQIRKKQIPSSLSIDGKSLKGSERSFGQGVMPMLMVNIYSHEHGLSIGQVGVDTGSASEEPYKAWDVLDLLELEGVVIAGDAAYATSNFVKKVRSKNADYIVPIKRNQRLLLAVLQDGFKDSKLGRCHVTLDKGHGRKEQRTYRTLSNIGEEITSRWPDVTTAVEVKRVTSEKDVRFVVRTTRPDGGQHTARNKEKIRTKENIAYYLSSLKLSPKQAAIEIRKHWGIENKLHWVLDTAFREDAWQVRQRRVARSLSVLRTMAFNLLKKQKGKYSIRSMMKQAAWSNTVLEKIIFSNF